MSRNKIICQSLAVVIAAFAAMQKSYAQNSVTKYSFDIEGASLGEALDEIYAQTDIQLLYPHDLAQREISPVEGRYTIDEALRIMLRDTDLSGRLIEGGVIVVSLKPNGTSVSVREENDVNDQPLKRGLLATVSAALFGVSAPAVAQDNPDSEDEVAILDTVTVTATRRETNLQETALSITAISGEELARKNRDNVAQFVGEVPGVTAVASGPSDNRIIIRNIASSSQEAGLPTTATYFDEYALGPRTSSAVKLVDIDRVEVLKGPQGTLFGRSAMGGIIRYIPNKPNTDAFAGGFNTYYSETEDGGGNQGFSGYLNIPLSDNFAIRAVGYAYDNSGFLDNVELGETDTDDEDSIGGRISARWQATDTLTIDATYFNQSVDAGNNSRVTTTRDPGDLSIAGDEGPDIPFDLSARTFIGGVSPSRDLDSELFNLRIENDFGGFVGSFIATTTEEETLFQFDEREFVVLRSGCACDNIGADGEPSTEKIDVLELRLVSQGDRLIDWIGGLYYEESESFNTQVTRYLGPDAFLFGAIPLTDGVVAIDSNSIGLSEEFAVYGEASLNISDKTKFTVGYRRSDIEFSRSFPQQTGLFAVLTGRAALQGQTFETKEEVDTFKFALEHKFSNDLFGYATASSGYRRGGFNEPTPVRPFSTFDSDTLWNYEAGLKSTWLEGRLTANASVFFIEYDDIQLEVQDPDTFARSTQNVGKAHVPGVEASIVFQATPELNFAFSGSLTDPELREDVPGGVSGMKGDRLPASANSNFTLSADWSKPITPKLDVFANGSYRFTGERYNDFNLDLDVALPSYELADARIGIESSDGYRVTLFAENLFDEQIAFLIDRQGAANFEAVPTNRPRTIGLSLSYDF